MCLCSFFCPVEVKRAYTHTHCDLHYTLQCFSSHLVLCVGVVFVSGRPRSERSIHTHTNIHYTSQMWLFTSCCCVCVCSCLRLKWSLTSWMTRCVMNVTVSSAMESTPPFTAVLWVASNTIASTAGLQSMLCPANTTTDRSPRTPETDPGQCLFVDTTTDLSPSWSQTVPAINKKCIIAKNSSI